MEFWPRWNKTYWKKSSMSSRPLGFVLAASDHGPVIVSRFDFNRSPDGQGYYGVGAQILGRGCYEKGEIEVIKNELMVLRQDRGDGVMALDCGANIGIISLEMAKYMLGWGEVWAYEAQERLFYALCGNIALANLFNISAFRFALSNKVGWIQAPEPDYLKPGSFGSFELRFTPKTEHIGQTIN